MLSLKFGIPLVLAGLFVVTGTTLSHAQTPVTPRPVLGISTNGMLVGANGAPKYGFANLHPTTWLGLNVIHANFAIVSTGGRHTMGNVAIVATDQPGMFVWITNVGVNGVLRNGPNGVTWEDSTGASGRYVPL
jgi:hypothetical protein